MPFCLGQFRGYFGDGALPAGFWRLYAVYMAMTVISSVVWALRSTPDQLQEMLDLVSRVVEDHDGFRSLSPKWYKES